MAEEAQTTPEPDNFEDAFSRLSALAEGQEPKTPDDVAEPQPSETVGKEADAPAPAPEAAADEGEEAVETAQETPQPEKSADTSETDTVLERLARLVKESAQPEPQYREAPQPQVQEQPLFSPEESEILSNYEKEWPDVAKAESLRRRAEYKELVSYVFNEVAKELRPLVETVHTISQRTHLSDLKSTVNDYDDVRDKVVDWVEKQPTYLQVAYKHVIENGSVDEVADLIDRYKRDSGVSAAPKAAAAPVARKAESELPSATKQAAAALAPVSSKRSAVLQTSDPEDFESAFAAFASKM